MTKWEYKTHYIALDKDDFILSALGKQGWELVSVISIEEKRLGWFDSGAETTGVVAFLKRPIEE